MRKPFWESASSVINAIRVCPTNVLQPAILETGLEGFWTPVMNMKNGLVRTQLHLVWTSLPDRGDPNASRIEEKNRPWSVRGPGDPFAPVLPSMTADAACPGRWKLPVSSARKSCPTSPKAIYSREVTITRREWRAHHPASALCGPNLVHRLRNLRT